MVELSVYNENLELQGIIDTYSSLIWTRKYYTPSTVELQCPATANNLALIKQYNIIEREDTNECVYIRDIKITADLEKGAVISAVCDSLTSLLYNRIAINVSDKMFYTPIKDNCINCSDANRNYSCLSVAGTGDFEIACSYQNSNLGEGIERILRIYKKGLKSYVNHTTNKVELCVFTGLDRTARQSINPQAVFSQEFDNLLSSEYQFSDIGAVNTIYVYSFAPPGVQPPTAIDTYIRGAETVGFGRIEKRIDVEPATRDIVLYPGSEYETVLSYIDFSGTLEKQQQAANSEVVNGTEHFEGSINTKAGYRTLWDLGDRVTIFNKAWGIELDERITEVCEVFDHTSNNIVVTFGEPSLTIWDKIKRG